MTSMTPPPPKANRLAGLEALRGIAALSVMLLHTPVIFSGLPRLFGKGYLGVDLFFMLSGYVMARGFERKMGDGMNVASFMWQRYIRMWPVMAVGGAIGLPLLWLRVQDPIAFTGIATANLLLLPISFQRETFPINVPAWTIFFILLGNLLHVLGLHRLEKPALMLAIATCLIAMIAIGISAGGLDVGARPENFLFGLPRLLFSYMIGMAIYRFWRDAPPISVPPVLGLCGMPLLMVGAWWLGIGSWLFDILFVSLACPLLIAGCMRLQRGAAAAAFVGAWSFPLYAVHFPLLIWVRRLGYGWLAAVIFALTVSLVVTIVELRWRKSHRSTFDA